MIAVVNYLKINKTTVIFIIVVLLAIFLRFYNLSSVPPSVSLDEASIGYNAYSILNTGADEYGTKFPLLLRAYDDWRPALYVYLVIPFVKIFGLNVLSVRLPSVILSVLTVIATYFLTIELFKTWSLKSGEILALLVSLFLAVSPWHIYISRLGHEANTGLAFFIFAMYFFIKKRIYLFILFITLSFVSYQSEKIFIPVMILGLFIIFRSEIIKFKKKIIIAGALSLIILIPFLKETFVPNALIRLHATNTFTANKERLNKQTMFLAKAVNENNLIGKLIYNRRALYLQIFAENYVSHFNPVWLFANPYDGAHKVPGIGVLYIWEAPLILLGLFFLFKQKLNPEIKKLIIVWILAAPLPAAITTDAPHAMRIYQMLPMPQILAALGIAQIGLFLDKYKITVNKFYLNKIASLSLIVIFIVSIYYFYNQYFIVFPKTQSASFQYALSQMVPFVLNNEKQYNKIIISNKDNLYQSYMFFLFYSKYDPKLYQNQGGTKSGGFAREHKFGIFEFKPIDWSKEEKNSKTLYIGNVNDFPNEVKNLIVIKNMDSKDTIRIVNR